MLELVDIQFIDKDTEDWGPWIFESERVEQEKAAEARREKAAKEKERKEQGRLANAPQFRTWTTANGKYKTTAKYRGMIAGQVRLELESKKVVSVPIDTLSDEDRHYIEERKKEARSTTP